MSDQDLAPEGAQEDPGIQVVIVGGDGAVEDLGALFRVRAEPWHEGEVVPHTSYDTPPGGMPEEEWREMLAEAARHAVNLEHFTGAFMQAIGSDIIESHDVPQDVAEKAITEFAATVYAEYHTETGPSEV